jgi:hypothetical protein
MIRALVGLLTVLVCVTVVSVFLWAMGEGFASDRVARPLEPAAAPPVRVVVVSEGR